MPGRIPPDFINQLLADSDIVEVIGRYVPLQKKGREFMARCPFHEEKTPSFSVIPHKQFYYCFGCGAGGTVIQFLMSHLNLGFVEAVETLAGFSGVEVPREAGSGDPEADKKAARRRERIFEALAKAADFYRENLASSKTATEYLARRGIGESTAKAFGVGYAPDGFDNLKRCFGDAWHERLLLAAGLLARNESTDRSYDKFRNRLMFPIRDRRGRVVAFGGRVLDEADQPKYLNSPETEVFQKRRTLYGAYELRQNHKLNEVIVVEGYMDVVSLAAHGVNNAVATLGTAVTEDHLRRLFQTCGKLVFCFDGDAAGRKAAASALQQALPQFRDGRGVGFMFLPEKEDPDSFVRTRGKEAFDKAVAQATPLSGFLFDHLREKLNLSLPEGRAAFAERARPLLAKLPRGSFRDLIMSELADKADVTVKHLTAATSGGREGSRPHPIGEGRRSRYSNVAVALLLSQPTLAEHAPPPGEIRRINHPDAALLADLLERIKQNPGITSAALLEQYRGGEYEQHLARLIHWPTTSHAKTEFRQAMEHVRRLAEEQTFNELLEKSKTQRLDEKEKNWLRNHLARKPAPQQSTQ